MKLKVYDIKGKHLKDIELSIPDISVSDYELSQAIRVYQNNLHQGTRQAKTKGEIAHSKRKPWRQKGTGRARAGHRGSPVWVGGGVAHGPKAYTRRLNLNKKQKARVLTYMIHQLSQNNKIIVLSTNSIDDYISTKDAIEFLRAVQLLPFKTIFSPSVGDEFTTKGFRNVKNILIRRTELLSPFDLFSGRNVIFTLPAVDIIKSRLINNE